MSVRVDRKRLADDLSRIIFEGIEDYGGIDEWCEKIKSFPSQYVEDVSWSVINHLSDKKIIEA